MDFDKNFRENIRYLRRKHSLTQKQMALILGIGVCTLSRLEAGNPTVRTHCGMLCRLCDHFDLSADEVLYGLVK